MKIDLQIHTNHSDGHETPEEIIALAKEGNLGVISITDHDIISGSPIAISKGKEEGVVVVPGVEITTGYRGQPLHVLGYNIDMQNAELVQFLSNINEYRQHYFVSVVEKVNENLRQSGRQEMNAEKYKGKEPKYYSIPGLALFLFEENIVEGRNDGFTYLVGIADVTPNIEPREAFEIIRIAGGKSFLSHPFAPLISLKNVSEDKNEQEKIVAEFKAQGMDGLECFQAGHDQEDVAFCLELSEKHNLLISAGSDWHGCLEKTGVTIKRWLPFYLQKLGDLEVPEERVKQILEGLGIQH